jgi:hypothetical protein
MAITQAVLVNDGGAPARIINFEAAEAITAGMCLEVNSSGKVLGADTDNQLIAGFALTDAASGAMCSMITGSGIVLNVHLDGTADIDIGDNLKIGEDGALMKRATVDDTPVAIALEAATDTAAINASSTLPLANPGVSLYKVLVK